MAQRGGTDPAASYRWKIRKMTKYRMRQDRYLLLNLRTQSLTFLDMNNKCKSEFRLSEIKGVSAVGSKKGEHDQRNARIVWHDNTNHRPYDLIFESQLDCENFIELAGRPLSKVQIESLGPLDHKEYPVTLKSGLGTSQPRLVVLNDSKDSMLVLDTKRKCKREIPYRNIGSIEIPRSKANMGGETCHLMLKGSNSVRLAFERAQSRIEFCEALRDLGRSIEIKDHSLAGDPECLRFNVAKINKVGVHKERVVYIDSKKNVFRSINLDKTYKEILIRDEKEGGLNLLNIERNINDKRRLDLVFKNREPLHYLFETPLDCEKFLHRCRTLTVPDYYDLRATDAELFTREALLRAGVLEDAKSASADAKSAVARPEAATRGGDEEDDDVVAPPPPVGGETAQDKVVLNRLASDFLPPPPLTAEMMGSTGPPRPPSAMSGGASDDEPPPPPLVSQDPFDDAAAVAEPISADPFAEADSFSNGQPQPPPPATATASLGPPPPDYPSDSSDVVPAPPIASARPVGGTPPPPAAPSAAHDRPPATDSLLKAKGTFLSSKTDAKQDAKRATDGTRFSPRAISVFAGTWNVGQSIVYDSLDDFIPSNRYDIYAIGLQEARVKDRSKWEVELTRHINVNFRGKPTKNEYTLVQRRALREINIFVYVRNALVSKISNVESGEIACGIGNVVGNKGAAAVSFNIYDTKLCFLSCHLAARPNKIVERRNDYRRICRELRLGMTNRDILSQFHHLFWLGDVNYRIEGEWSDVIEKRRACLKSGDWSALRPRDQLYLERQKNRVFHGFVEAPLTFGPTYKFEKRNNVVVNKDWQVPSWCDRILTRSFPGCLLRQLDYYSTPTMFGSDHRPVAAIFQFVPLPAPDVLRPAFEQRTRDNVCEVRLSDLRVELEEWREGLEMEELKAVHALRTGSGGAKQSQGGGHWAENLSGSELVLRADFSSPVFARNIFKKSRKNRKSTSSKRRVDKGFTWSPLSFEASIADDDYVRRHHIVVGVTIQAPDQTIINLGTCFAPRLLLAAVLLIDIFALLFLYFSGLVFGCAWLECSLQGLRTALVSVRIPARRALFVFCCTRRLYSPRLPGPTNHSLPLLRATFHRLRSHSVARIVQGKAGFQGRRRACWPQDSVNVRRCRVAVKQQKR